MKLRKRNRKPGHPLAESTSDARSSGPDELRRQAEGRLGAATSGPLMAQPHLEGDAAHLIHELQVHQIELEMQNEELRRVYAELEASRARYVDLYDLAPVGYCTISVQGPSSRPT